MRSYQSIAAHPWEELSPEVDQCRIACLRVDREELSSGRVDDDERVTVVGSLGERRGLHTK